MRVNDEFLYPAEHAYRKCHFRITKVDAKAAVAVDLNETANCLSTPIVYCWLAKSALDDYAKWLILDGKDVRETVVKNADAAAEFMPKGAQVPMDAGIDGLSFQKTGSRRKKVSKETVNP